MQILENDRLYVEISDHGAELSRVFDKLNGCECLHDANPKFWNRHAPVLFPFVGASYNGVYHYGGSEYKMGQHGFARDVLFKFVSNDGVSVCHELTDSESTYAKYPFHFKLTIIHTLNENTINVSWRVENTDTKELLFNIGAHPAFLIGEGREFSDVSLDLHTSESLKFYRIEDPGSGCCFVDRPIDLAAEGGIIRLTNDFFSEGVYIFADGSVDTVTMSVPYKKLVTVCAKGFPYFGIWSKAGAPFICLEPWKGRTDCYGFNGELSEKEGIIKLGCAEVFNADYDIIIH